MAYYPDLSPCDYFGRWEKILVAVGWHEPGYPFTIGPVSKAFFAKLFRMLSNPWQPVIVAGHQRCHLCRFTGGPAELRFEGNTVSIGSVNLFVPGDGVVYVAPGLIAHYIDAHEYNPPPPFQDCVMRCPEMSSTAYLREMRARGLTITPNS